MIGSLSISLFLIGMFLNRQKATDLADPTGNTPANSTAAPSTSLPADSSSTDIPAPVESAESSDQQSQLEAQIAQQEEEKVAQEMSQQGQIPVRFSCDVNGFRTGEGRSLLLLSVSAPDVVPEVWVTVKTEKGVIEGSVTLENGTGQQTVSLRNPTQSFRPEVKVYSKPIFTEQYEMCSFR